MAVQELCRRYRFILLEHVVSWRGQPQAIRLDNGFEFLDEAQAIIEAWRMDYNHHCPHSSLGHQTPNEFIAQRQGQQIVEKALCPG